MKLVTVWFTEEEKAFLDELAKTEDVTLSKALREGAQLYFEDAATKLGMAEWLEARRGEGGEARPAERRRVRDGCRRRAASMRQRGLGVRAVEVGRSAELQAARRSAAVPLDGGGGHPRGALSRG